MDLKGGGSAPGMRPLRTKISLISWVFFQKIYIIYRVGRNGWHPSCDKCWIRPWLKPPAPDPTLGGSGSRISQTRGATPPPGLGEGHQSISWLFFLKTAWKWKKLNLEMGCASLVPPPSWLRQCIDSVHCCTDTLAGCLEFSWTMNWLCLFIYLNSCIFFRRKTPCNPNSPMKF